MVFAERLVIGLEAVGGFFGEAYEIGHEEFSRCRGGDDRGLDVVIDLAESACASLRQRPETR